MDTFDAGTDPTEALRRVVHEVYAVEPAEFVAARKTWVARLRSAGLREVAKEAGALRKPSVSAAAVNALVRAEDPVVEQLRDVGSRMRHAQSALDAAGLAALRGERDAVLRDWVAAAVRHAPTPLAGATEGEVRDTAIAALADAEATDVVLSGHLTRALSYSGFGEVDVADAVARTSTGVVLTRIEGGGGTEDEPGSAGEEDDVEPEESAADDESADEEHAELLAQLARDLDEAEKDVAAARAARKQAADAAARADQAVTVAQEQVAQAERLLASAAAQLEKAGAAQERTASALVDAEEELSASREQRDAAKAALEEAEDG